MRVVGGVVVEAQICVDALLGREISSVKLPPLDQPNQIREESQTKNVEKVHNFLETPLPSPRMIWTFLNFGKLTFLFCSRDTTLQVRSPTYATCPNFRLSYLFLKHHETGPIFSQNPAITYFSPKIV